MRERELIAALKSFVKARGLTYKVISQSLDVAEITIRRDFHRQKMSLERVLKICDLLAIELDEVVAQSRRDSEAIYYTLTDEEDRYFFEHLDEFAYFTFLSNLYTPAAVAKKYKLTRARTFYFLNRLEKRGFLKLLEDENVRFMKGPLISPARGGQISKKFGAMAKDDFVSIDFTAHDQIAKLITVEWTEDSRKWWNGEVLKLFNLVIHRHNLDEMSREKKQFYGVFLAGRPWREPHTLYLESLLPGPSLPD